MSESAFFILVSFLSLSLFLSHSRTCKCNERNPLSLSNLCFFILSLPFDQITLTFTTLHFELQRLKFNIFILKILSLSRFHFFLLLLLILPFYSAFFTCASPASLAQAGEWDQFYFFDATHSSHTSSSRVAGMHLFHFYFGSVK